MKVVFNFKTPLYHNSTEFVSPQERVQSLLKALKLGESSTACLILKASSYKDLRQELKTLQPQIIKLIQKLTFLQKSDLGADQRLLENILKYHPQLVPYTTLTSALTLELETRSFLKLPSRSLTYLLLKTVTLQTADHPLGTTYTDKALFYRYPELENSHCTRDPLRLFQLSPVAWVGLFLQTHGYETQNSLPFLQFTHSSTLESPFLLSRLYGLIVKKVLPQDQEIQEALELQGSFQINCNDLALRIREGKFTIIPTGSLEHMMMVCFGQDLLHRGYLIVCNTGKASRPGKTLIAFCIDLQKVTLQHIQNLMACCLYQDLSNCFHLCFESLPQDLQLDSPYSDNISSMIEMCSPKQIKQGTCINSAIKAAIRAGLLLNRLPSKDPLWKLKIKILSRACNLAMREAMGKHYKLAIQQLIKNQALTDSQLEACRNIYETSRDQREHLKLKYRSCDQTLLSMYQPSHITPQAVSKIIVKDIPSNIPMYVESETDLHILTWNDCGWWETIIPMETTTHIRLKARPSRDTVGISNLSYQLSPHTQIEIHVPEFKTTQVQLSRSLKREKK